MASDRHMPQVAGVTHQWVDAGDLRMHVAELGSGPPLVLLHGWPQHWYCWHRVMPLLARRHRVIALDLRGFGWSDAPPTGYDKAQLAADVAAALDALEIEQAALAGHDWGTMVGFWACRDFPERFTRFVAMNGAHPWVQPDALTALSTAARTVSYQVPISTPIVGRHVVRRLILPLADRALRWSDTWDEGAARSYRAQFDDDARVHASVQLYRTWLLTELPRLRHAFPPAEFTTPTLVLHGVHDPVLRPALVRSGIERVPSMRLELVQRAGHFVQEDQPELVAELTSEFVSAGARRPRAGTRRTPPARRARTARA